jgi:hypothetical protein
VLASTLLVPLFGNDGGYGVVERRDWRAEEARAANRHIDNIVEIRGLRDAGELQGVYQVAQAFILCGLPYKPTEERQITKKARLGDGSTLVVTFIAGLAGVGMPYGADRVVLHWILDRAVKTSTRFISWKTAQEFISDVGLSKSGKNNRDLRDRLQRLKGLAISVQRTSSGSEASLMLPVIRRASLPTSVGQQGERMGEISIVLADRKSPLGIELDSEFFDELMKFHVPVPRELINKTRNSAQLQDCVLFLCWRSFAAKNESLIPWEFLRAHLWQDDKTEGRINLRFAKAIKWLKAIWPELRAEATSQGLKIAPPAGGAVPHPRCMQKVWGPRGEVGLYQSELSGTFVPPSRD